MTPPHPLSRLGPSIRCWTGNLLVALAFAGLLATSTAPQWDLGFPLAPLAVAGALILTTGVGLYGRRLAMTGRKQRAARAADAMSRDPRPPVLYLRSFVDDEVVAEAHIVKGFIQLSTEEEQFARAFDRIGPFIAIGDPREGLPDLGAVRLYVGDASWQQRVEDLLAHARLVVIRLSATEGLLWELQAAIARSDPNRLLLLVPGGRERYASIADIANRWLPKPLPPLPKARTAIGTLQGIVRFRRDWSPEFLPSRMSYLRTSLSAPLTPPLLLTLRPVFEQLGAPWSKPRLGVFSVLMATVMVAALVLFVALAIRDF